MNEIEGFILAGGAGSRMGSDTAFLHLGGKTFIKRAAAAGCCETFISTLG